MTQARFYKIIKNPLLLCPQIIEDFEGSTQFMTLPEDLEFQQKVSKN